MKINSMAVSMVCGAIGLTLAACAGGGKLPYSVVGAFEQAYNRNDVAGCVALFTDDAQILPEHGAIVSGHDGIQRYLEDQMTPVASFDTETEMTLVRGDIAIEQGHYRVRNVRRGSNVEAGKYLHVWRNVGGDWKLYRMIYNTDIAPEAQVSVAQASEPEL